LCLVQNHQKFWPCKHKKASKNFSILHNSIANGTTIESRDSVFRILSLSLAFFFFLSFTLHFKCALRFSSIAFFHFYLEIAGERNKKRSISILMLLTHLFTHTGRVSMLAAHFFLFSVRPFFSLHSVVQQHNIL
jgi:hypothetical protein